MNTRIKAPFQYWIKLQSWQKIFIGLIAGSSTGLAIGNHALYLKPIGTLFINAIHMMITPVVFVAIVSAVISMSDVQKMRRMSIKAVSLYMLCMGMAALIGLSVATLIAPGSGLQLQLISQASVALPAAPSLIDIIVNMVPANPVSAFVSGNLLQILVFAVVLGVSINLAGEKGKPVVNFFQSLSQVVFKFAGLVMSFAPYGIFALIACITGEFGVKALLPLFKFVGTVYLCCALHILIVYLSSLAVVARLNPITFFKGIIEALMFAFGSTSSVATLPTTMRCVEKNLGVSKSVAQFLLPLGTSLNLNGLTIYLSVAVVFAANLYGIQLNLSQYLAVAVSIVLTSMGAGGVPGSAIIVISAVMSSVGIPLGAVPLIAGVDRINDIASTVTSVAGDAYTTVMVAKSEGEFDEEVYNKEKNHNEGIPRTLPFKSV